MPVKQQMIPPLTTERIFYHASKTTNDNAIDNRTDILACRLKQQMITQLTTERIF